MHMPPVRDHLSVIPESHPRPPARTLHQTAEVITIPALLGPLLFLIIATAVVFADDSPQEVAQPIPPEQVPAVGTFFSMALFQPPLPMNPFPELDVYLLREGVYVYDDRNVDYFQVWHRGANTEPSAFSSSGGMMTMSEPPPSPCPECPPCTNCPPSGFTNSPPYNGPLLHLKVPVWTNGNLLMAYGGGDSNRPPYDLFLTTNLSAVVVATNEAPRIPWRWVYRTAQGQTNWTLFSVPAGQAFFLLANTYDSDNDNLTDAYESLVCASNCDSIDLDGDGIPDRWEVLHGLNPLVADSASDSDGDGIINFDEWRYGLNPLLDDANQPGMFQEFRYDARGRMNKFYAPGQFIFFHDLEGNILQVIYTD